MDSISDSYSIVKEQTIPSKNIKNLKRKKNMPNWVYNEVYLTGTKEQIQEIKDFLKGKDTPEDSEESVFCFAKLIIPPEDMYTGNMGPEDWDKHPVNWFNWCPEHWGTKWPACDAEILEEDEEHILYSFKTAWSSPDPIIEALGKTFKGSMEFKYYEEQVTEFAGKVLYEHGELVDETFVEGDNDEIWDFMENEFGFDRNEFKEE